jgi:hypothetical protein
MLLTKKMLSAAVGLAMLATPAAALAGHRVADVTDLPMHVAQNPGPQMEPVKWHGGYHQVCDADRDDCRWVPNQPVSNGNMRYQCDADGDDCRWVGGYGPQYWPDHGGYDYGAPFSWYRAEPPARYGLSQRRNWLVARRQRAYFVMAKMRARGDRHAEERMVRAIDDLNARIANLNRQMSGRW